MPSRKRKRKSPKQDIGNTNLPGINDSGMAIVERKFCTKCHRVNDLNATICFHSECNGRKFKDCGRNNTRYREIHWDTADSRDPLQFPLQEPELHIRNKEDLMLQFGGIANHLMAELLSFANQPGDYTREAFDSFPEEVQEGSGYFKGKLNEAFVEKHFSNKCPPGFALKRRADEKGVFFGNLKSFTCPLHWDALPGALVVLSGKKYIYLAHPKYRKTLTPAGGNNYKENPFEMETSDGQAPEGFIKIEAGPGDVVLILPEWLHCIMSVPGTVGVSLKTQFAHDDSAHPDDPPPKKKGGQEKSGPVVSPPIQTKHNASVDGRSRDARRCSAAAFGCPNIATQCCGYGRPWTECDLFEDRDPRLKMTWDGTKMAPWDDMEKAEKVKKKFSDRHRLERRKASRAAKRAAKAAMKDALAAAMDWQKLCGNDQASVQSRSLLLQFLKRQINM